MYWMKGMAPIWTPCMVPWGMPSSCSSSLLCRGPSGMVYLCGVGWCGVGAGVAWFGVGRGGVGRGAVRRGMGCGVAWRGVLWCGVVWCGVVWCGVAWRGVAWRGVAWRGVAWRGVAWRGVAWRGVVWRGVVWCGVVWCGVVWCGVVWCGLWNSLPSPKCPVRNPLCLGASLIPCTGSVPIPVHGWLCLACESADRKLWVSSQCLAQGGGEGGVRAWGRGRLGKGLG